MKKKLVFFILLFIVSCTTIKEVPVEIPVVKTEYINTHSTDTIYKDRYVYTKEKGDTVYIYEKEYLYKSKCEVDTFIKTDTITHVVYKEIEVEVNKLKNWQIFLMCVGGGFILILIYKLYNKFKK